MESTRENLIELLDNVQQNGVIYKPSQTDERYGTTKQISNSEVADYLIANGVVIEERKQGHWITKNGITFCSECMICGSSQWKRCPVCEAKMVKEVTENDVDMIFVR